MADERWEKGIMLHGWPECGPGRVEIEELYQMFKARLVTEVEGVLPTQSPDIVQIVPLRASDNGEGK